MYINLIDLKKQHNSLKRELKEAVNKSIESGQFILGKEVEGFEKEVAEYIGTRYAIGVSSGTDAIHLTLKAYGIGKGDSVITPAYTFYATAGAIARCGARPIFCDINPDTYTISPTSLKKVFTKKVKAIVPVHLFGQSADMDSIMSYAQEKGVVVIEDAAQAFGAEYKDKKVGSIGGAGCFSFYPAKNLGALGDAGIVVTNDRSVAASIRLLRNHGHIGGYRHITLGYNCRMDSIQAAVLRVKLRYIDKWNAQRRRIAQDYNDGLGKLDIQLPFVGDHRRHIFHLYVIRFRNQSQRDEVTRSLREKGIDVRTYYPIPLHLQRCFKYLGYKRGDFPEAEMASKTTLALPIYPELTKQEQRFIIENIIEVIAS